MSYEILEHPADAKFRAVGNSREETFSEAVKAFAEIVGSDPEAGEVRHQIEVEAEKLDSLVYDFLHKLIMLQEMEDVAVCQTEEIELEEEGASESFRLEATVWTDPIEPGMNLMDIKAPTYNEMKADYEEGEGWVIEAVLDI